MWFSSAYMNWFNILYRDSYSKTWGAEEVQRSCYCGHKWAHCLTYQTISTKDWLVCYMHGPEVERSHHFTLYRQSVLDFMLQKHLKIDGNSFYIFGDAAYMLKPWLKVNFKRAFCTLEQQHHNISMSSVRKSVESSYKDLKQIWTSL